MNTFIAFVDFGTDDGHHEFARHPDVLLEYVGRGVRLSGRDPGTPLSASTIRTIMELAVESQLSSTAQITWVFSSVVLSVGDIGAALSRWDDTGEPPLLSIIAIDIGHKSHVTRGMAAFTGYEFAARFSDPSQSRDAARNLARLARHAMLMGELRHDADYEAIDGHPLRLTWQDSPGEPRMVTIVF